MPTTKPVITRQFVSMLLTLGPILVFVLTFRREVRLAWLFIEYEIKTIFTTHVFWFLVFALLLFSTSRLRTRLRLSRIGALLKQSAVRFPWVAGLAVISVLFFIVSTVRVHYRFYSEVHYPMTVLEAIKHGEYVKATNLCARYFNLYPQRREGGGMPDPVCVPFQQFRRTAYELHEFLDDRPSGLGLYPSLRDSSPINTDFVLPNDPIAARTASELFEVWSGRASVR